MPCFLELLRFLVFTLPLKIQIVHYRIFSAPPVFTVISDPKATMCTVS